ncbi:MAG: 30S ribosomal protein S17e, partial [Candidatus Thorarchaeota archaeon]
MGKVRTVLIKNVSKELINKYPNVFTTDFESISRYLSKIFLFVSKSVVNTLGY